MENFERKINRKFEENSYSFLKNEMLSGRITLEQVRDKLIQMDQSTPDRIFAYKNLDFLKDPSVFKFITSKPEAIDGYKRLLSFTEFHVAQDLAMRAEDKAIDHFQRALEASLDDDWSYYIRATILYLKGSEIPEDFIVKSKNMYVLRNLNAGLKKRGFPSYKEDYLSFSK